METAWLAARAGRTPDTVRKSLSSASSSVLTLPANVGLLRPEGCEAFPRRTKTPAGHWFEKTASAKGSKGSANGQAERLGLTVRALTADEKQQAQTEGTLVVENVAGPAAAAGVQPGDIILGVNGKQVRTTAELVAAAKTAGKTIALLIQRQDQQIFVPLRLN